ncbi:MAG: BadF/BadG/BcrA/BcrD ATPase family protein [Candidatus Acidiferrum sp.]
MTNIAYPLLMSSLATHCVLGIDGGGTKTECVLMDFDGNVLARGRAGPANPLRIGFDAAAGAVQSAAQLTISAACQRNVGGLKIDALCAGLAGVAQPPAAEQIRAGLLVSFDAENPGIVIKVCTDLEIALAGAPAGPAIVLVAGTGSAAIGRDSSGHVARTGGLGPVLGDEGSAYWIGRTAVAAVFSEHKTRGASSRLEIQILRRLRYSEWSNVERQPVSSGEKLFPRIFPAIAAAGDAGDEVAQAILRRAAEHLAQLVADLAQTLRLHAAPFSVYKCGGTVGRSTFFDAQLDELLAQAASSAVIGSLPISPVDAAAHLALQLIPEPRSVNGPVGDR